MGKKSSSVANETRANQEGQENMESLHVDGPSSRYQDQQQVNAVATTLDTQTPAVPFQRKRTRASGGVLKQEVASEIVRGKGGPDSELSSSTVYGYRGIPYSGDGGTISGGAADTPVMRGDFQGKTRVDKRLSDPNKDINFVAADTVVVEYDNVAPLAKSDSTVGYNGNPKNEAVRSQKIAGATPSEILYDRSLDIIAQDEMLFAVGQCVKQKGVNYEDYPTKSQEYDAATRRMQLVDFTNTRGNYAPRELVVKFASDAGGAYVSSFEVIEDDLSASKETVDVVNQATTNEKIFINRAEMARQRIDANCGSPSQDHFNPLGRSIPQESATVGYMMDLEASLGATMFTAYKMANKARSYYLFRTSKDGQDLKTPAVDALYGHLLNGTSSYQNMALFEAARTTSDKQRGGAFKCTAGMAQGSAMLMINIFDSVNKYKTKADIINQPRGLKLHYQTADNNINVLRVDRNFVAALNSVDVFSTVNRGYDAMNAICATDGVRLVYPYSWAKALKFTRSGSGAARTR